ncbi:MAG TPA: hypothetical protein VNH11_27965 [Pirellulales bacterium]|nr:hypothetical protein [Pirellulales bacterium]
MGNLSTFLFARPSFFEGAARLVDFGGFLNEYNYSASEREADNLALWADWTAAGNDVRAAWVEELARSRDRVGLPEHVKKLKAP